MSNDTKWQELLEEVIDKPGKLSKAYTIFHDYSLGNAMAALFQCDMMGIEPGPIATYPKWKTLGRQVKRGAKALCLCMPVTITKKETKDKDKDGETITAFVWRNQWFVLSQTEGKAYDEKTVNTAGFSLDTALSKLEVKRVPFDITDGNTQGFANSQGIAVSPIAENPLKTAIHEIAHVLLGHCKEHEMNDNDETPRDEREMEAEGVAYLVLDAIGVDSGKEFSRGYIQTWANGKRYTNAQARKMFSVADKILKAGSST